MNTIEMIKDILSKNHYTASNLLFTQYWDARYRVLVQGDNIVVTDTIYNRLYSNLNLAHTSINTGRSRKTCD